MTERPAPSVDGERDQRVVDTAAPALRPLAPRFAAVAVRVLLALALGACDEVAVERGAASAARVELVTGGARAEEALPLVVAIHGLGDTPRGLAPLFDGFPLPARVVLPPAPTPYAGGGSWFPVPWDPGGEAAFERGVESAVVRLAEVVETLVRERPTLGRPVVTGFSQGGILAFGVATSRPDLVSAALPIAGTLPRALWPSALPHGGASVPLRALHGGSDDLLPPGPTEALVAHLRRLGFDAELRVYPGTGHVVTPAMLRDYHALLRDAVAKAAAPPKSGDGVE